MRHALRRIGAASGIWALLLGGSGAAQSPASAPRTQAQTTPAVSLPDAPLRVETAIAIALANYPAIRAATARVDAAQAGVALARTSYLPRTDVLWQENRATRNNVAGLLLPQGVIPSISGPVGATSSESVWGSAAGGLFSWEPFDFGLRSANVGVARNVVAEAAANAEVTRLQVAIRAADTFLSALAAEEAVRVAQANLDRLQVIATSVSTLVRNQLRPGADGSRADAEVAAARVQLLRAQLAVTNAHAALADAIGFGGQDVSLAAGGLLQQLPSAPASVPPLELHPLARADAAAADASHSRAEALGRAYVPRVNFQSAIFARGSAPAGVGGAGSEGLWPATSNWAAGLTLSFSLFDVAGIRAHRQIEVDTERVERAQAEETIKALRAQNVRASAALEISRQIVEAIPAELQAARDAESRARARYDAGLAPLTEVADAARLLAQAESDDVLSRLAVWQALLSEAGVRGNIAIFLDQVK